jgi:hypothetical protein
MKYVLMGTGTLALGLAVLLWATAPLSGAPKGGHPPAAHPPAGHPAPAHVGSVHYGARPEPGRVAPGRVGPAVHAGAVRSEHYEGRRPEGGYRNPYHDEYFRHFRPGYRSYFLDDVEYYGYDDLPGDCPPVVINGVTYYFCDGVYYQPYIYDGQTIYLVVPME